MFNWNFVDILTFWHLTFWFWHYDKFDIGTEGTDSTSTDGNDIGTILSHFHWWILRLSAILEKWLTDSLTDSPNNIGLRDASASKKELTWLFLQVDICCIQGCNQHSDKEHGLGSCKVQGQGEFCFPWLDLVARSGKGKPGPTILSANNNTTGSCKWRSWPLGAHLG